MSSQSAGSLKIDWGEQEKDADDRRRWLGAWLVSVEGEEGEYFYDGPAGRETIHSIPPDAIGFRLRFYPSQNEVSVNLELGPMASVLEDYIFEATVGENMHVSVCDLIGS